MNNSIEDVIFFGAGASMAEGAPSQDGLLKEYFENNNLEKVTPEMNDRLGKFFISFFGLNTTENNCNHTYPSFEEILGILELAISREETYKGYSFKELTKIREDLIFLIAIILEKKLREPMQRHNVLIHRLKEEGTLCKTAFISLNYDILIDNALIAIRSDDDYDVDYGIDFTNFHDSGNNGDKWQKPREGKEIYLFKLHGSLNWLYCQTCLEMTLTPKEKGASNLALEPKPCEKCQTDKVPIIIPPTFFKVMSNYYLQQVWNKAEKLLTQAKRIIFCGYSFPDADIHIKYLLKRAEVNGGSTPEIFIFNNCSEKREDIKTIEEKRYKRFFSEKDKVEYTGKSFEDFCKR